MSACGSENPVCDDDTFSKLFNECELSTGGILPRNCSTAPTADSTFVHFQKACEIDDPKLDAACIRESSCEEILNRKCVGSSNGGSSSFAQCFSACVGVEQVCTSECDGEFETVCSECALDCVRDRNSCVDKC